MQAAHDLLGALLAISASADVASRRIPNLLPSCIAAAGLVYAISHRGVLAALGDLVATAVAAALLVVLWRAGALGGGDVKLFVACMPWLGAGRAATFAAATVVAGGVVALSSLAAALRDSLAVAVPAGATSIGARVRPIASVPYGVAIAVGALFAMRG